MSKSQTYAQEKEAVNWHHIMLIVMLYVVLICACIGIILALYIIVPILYTIIDYIDRVINALFSA